MARGSISACRRAILERRTRSTAWSPRRTRRGALFSISHPDRQLRRLFVGPDHPGRRRRRRDLAEREGAARRRDRVLGSPAAGRPSRDRGRRRRLAPVTGPHGHGGGPRQGRQPHGARRDRRHPPRTRDRDARRRHAAAVGQRQLRIARRRCRRYARVHRRRHHHDAGRRAGVSGWPRGFHLERGAHDVQADRAAAPRSACPRPRAIFAPTSTPPTAAPSPSRTRCMSRSVDMERRAREPSLGLPWRVRALV